MSLKVGIIGLGYWGRELFKYFGATDSVEIVAGHDVNLQRLEGLERAGVNYYSQMEEMFEKERLDAVVISTPPTEHLLPTRLAAQKGIHVFCEKPIAASLDDSDRMIETCKQNKVILMVAFKHRFAKAFAYVKNRAAELGKPLWAMYTYPLWKVDDPGWKFLENGTKGIVVENMVHAFDGLRYLFGDVERLYAEGDNFIFKNVRPPDSAIITIRFTNGAIGAIGGGCTSDQRISREYLDLHFEKGVAHIYGMLDRPYNLRMVMREEAFPEEHVFEGSDGVREEIRHFVDCIRNGKEPLSTGDDGRKALQIALATIESIRSRTTVRLID